MANPTSSFRLRMVVLFGLSMLASGLLTFLLYKGLQLYYHENARPGDLVVTLRRIMRQLGDVTVFMTLFVPLSLLFFFRFTRSYASYFDRISHGIHRLAEGDFNSKVELQSNDEFQSIAEHINRAGEKLKQAIERGDFAESSKDQLVLNLAHDLRTPLTSVIGYLDFILTNDDLSDEQARHYTTIAYTKARRLEKLIEELFGITRMNYGNRAVERKPTDLSELLNQLNEEMYPIFENNRLTARLDVAPHALVSGEAELLARVFENLLANAARYGRDGQYVDIVCRIDAAEVIVQVINYGDSIPEEQLPYLFEMFFTGDNARTHQGGSTGLGLFIAHNIVERHGGKLTAQSSVVRTCFEVRLPRFAEV